MISFIYVNLKVGYLAAMIILWIAFGLHLLVPLRFPAQSYGLRTISEGPDDRSHEMTYLFSLKLGFNLLSLILIWTSGYIRTCLLAPTTMRSNDGRMNVGYQSLFNFFSVSWSRRLVWMTLGLSSLPIHLLYNSMIINVHKAYDAYEVLVTKDFLDGSSFNISTLSPTRFADQKGAPISMEEQFPLEWPALDVLQAKLEQVQKNATVWTSLDKSDCINRYATNRYSSYRTVIIVSDWSPPESKNSALAIGALPGYPNGEVTTRFLAICPESWINSTAYASKPSSTPYIWPLRECADSTPVVPVSCPISSEEIFSSGDICFGYQSDTNYEENGNPRVSFEQCLSEPVSDTTARFVFVPKICFVVGILLGIQALAATAGYFIIPGQPILEYKDCDDGYPEDSESHKIRFLLYLTIQLCIWIWAMVLFYSGLSILGPGTSPTSVDDESWFYGMLIWGNWIQILLTIRSYMEGNFADYYAKGGPLMSHLRYGLPLGLYNMLLHSLAGIWMIVSIIDHSGLDSLTGNAASLPIAVLDTALDGRSFNEKDMPVGNRIFMPFLIAGVVIGSVFLIKPCCAILRVLISPLLTGITWCITKTSEFARNLASYEGRKLQKRLVFQKSFK